MKLMALTFTFLFSVAGFAHTCVSMQATAKAGTSANFRFEFSKDDVFSYDGPDSSVRVIQMKKGTCSQDVQVSLFDTLDFNILLAVFLAKPLSETDTYGCPGGTLTTAFVHDYSNKFDANSDEQLVDKQLNINIQQANVSVKIGECSDLIKDFANLEKGK